MIPILTATFLGTDSVITKAINKAKAGRARLPFRVSLASVHAKGLQAAALTKRTAETSLGGWRVRHGHVSQPPANQGQLQKGAKLPQSIQETGVVKTGDSVVAVHGQKEGFPGWHLRSPFKGLRGCSLQACVCLTRLKGSQNQSHDFEGLCSSITSFADLLEKQNRGTGAILGGQVSFELLALVHKSFASAIIFSKRTPVGVGG